MSTIYDETRSNGSVHKEHRDNVDRTDVIPVFCQYMALIAMKNAKMNLYVNGNYYATLLIPRSGDWGQFSQTTIEIPVVLQAGANTIKIQKDDPNGNFAQYDYIDVSSPIVPVNGSSVSANN